MSNRREEKKPQKESNNDTYYLSNTMRLCHFLNEAGLRSNNNEISEQNDEFALIMATVFITPQKITFSSFVADYETPVLVSVDSFWNYVRTNKLINTKKYGKPVSYKLLNVGKTETCVATVSLHCPRLVKKRKRSDE